MSRVVRIEDATVARMQKWALPFDDTPGSIVERLCELAESVAASAHYEPSPQALARLLADFGLDGVSPTHVHRQPSMDTANVTPRTARQSVDSRAHESHWEYHAFVDGRHCSGSSCNGAGTLAYDDLHFRGKGATQQFRDQWMAATGVRFEEFIKRYGAPRRRAEIVCPRGHTHVVEIEPLATPPSTV